MKSKSFNLVAIDLGSSKIATIVAHINKKGESSIIGQNLYFSEGIRSGIITNVKEANNAIVNAIYDLEKKYDHNIKQVELSITGAGTKSYYVHGKINITANKQISTHDIQTLIHNTLAAFKVNNQEIIHCFPIEFTIDEYYAIDNPIGMCGHELKCHLHIIVANTNLLTNLGNCFATCGIEITNVILAIYATSIACLSDDEKNMGAIIIDMGARTTTFGIFMARKLIYAGHVEFGGWHITSDIAKIFSVSFNVAEKLKILHGNASPSSFDKNSVINIAHLDPDNYYNPNLVITSMQLSAIIHARAEEIMLMIKAQYSKIALNQFDVHRLIMTGGGSSLRNIQELASNIFEQKVRIGKPKIVVNFTEDSMLQMYPTTIGIVINRAMKQLKMSSDIENKNNHWLKKMLSWFKKKYVRT
jgi:cell division protein FtsA